MSARYQIQVLVKGKWLSSDTCSAVEADHIRRFYGNDTTVRLVPVIGESRLLRARFP